MAWKSQEKAWRYVGRFMESFANVEAAVDSIFEIMFNLNEVSMILLQSIDLRKKVELIKCGFEHQKVEHGKTLGRVHEFRTIRNAIAHSQFEPVPLSSRLEDGVMVHYKAGIEFSYIDDRRRMQVPTTALIRKRKEKKLSKLKKKKELKRQKEPKKGNNEAMPDDYVLDKSTITYSEFDEYDAELRKIMEDLVEIAGTVTPINQGIEVVRDIAKIVASSDNIIVYQKPSLRLD